MVEMMWTHSVDSQLRFIQHFWPKTKKKNNIVNTDCPHFIKIVENSHIMRRYHKNVIQSQWQNDFIVCELFFTTGLINNFHVGILF